MFSFEFCEISKNYFFTEHLWTTPSEAFQNQKRNEEKEFLFFLKTFFSYMCLPCSYSTRVLLVGVVASERSLVFS